MYQYGSLIFLKDDDPEVEDYQSAVDKAVELSWDDSAYGVWTGQRQGSDLLAIVYGGEVFEKH